MTPPVRGLVSLVGAGPGHPDHLTQKASRRLREADLVLYDALVSPEVLALAVNAQLVCVGKRAGREQLQQSTIDRLLVTAGLEGRRVVRLKGGDPFVFGRGGEEALALQSSGVSFEVVPGVTTAVAGPTLAGIPLTHRGTSSGFVVLTGSDEGTCEATIAALPPGLLTVVAMMSVRGRQRLAGRLLGRGWPVDTPSALLLGVATPQMWTWRGRLADLGSVVLPPENASAPGTIVVGAVAGLRIDLFDGDMLSDAAVPA